MEKLNRFKSVVLLYLATLAAQLAYPIERAWANQQSIVDILLPSILALSAITIPCLVIGHIAASKLGLKLTSGRYLVSRAELKFTVLSAVALGLFLLFLRWQLQPFLPAEIKEYGFRGVTGGLLVSIGAAVGEEVWFRYGLLSLFFMLYLKLREQPPTHTQAIGLITLVAFFFGLAHLPQLMSFGAGTGFAVVATVLGNVAVGILYGWCFWRYSLAAAILSHLVLDLVLHVLPALF